VVEENRRLTGTLEIIGIALNLKLGVHAFERVGRRRVPVDLAWTGSLIPGGEPAVDYSRVCSLLKSSLREEYLYIEDLAVEILQLLKGQWAGSWKVTVRKLAPPLDPPAAEARITVEG